MNITELCVNCKQNNSCTMFWKISNKKCPHFIRKTNADRIRAMSDEKMARFICGCCECDSGYCPGANLCVFGGSKANGLLKWLQQPAEVSNG